MLNHSVASTPIRRRPCCVWRSYLRRHFFVLLAKSTPKLHQHPISLRIWVLGAFLSPLTTAAKSRAAWTHSRTVEPFSKAPGRLRTWVRYCHPAHLVKREESTQAAKWWAPPTLPAF